MRTMTISAVVFLSALAPADSADNDWSQCTGADAARALPACTRVIRSAGSKEIAASAYYNRGIAYAANSEPDRAIADFNESIRLDPTDPDAFISRGSAYLAAGDHSRA